MAFDVVITKTAEEDINEAISYIAVVLSNPIAATTLADDYVEAISQIADNPFLFHYLWKSIGAEHWLCCGASGFVGAVRVW